MKETVELNNMDIFSIAGRYFRFEYEQPKRKARVYNEIYMTVVVTHISPSMESEPLKFVSLYMLHCVFSAVVKDFVHIAHRCTGRGRVGSCCPPPPQSAIFT